MSYGYVDDEPRMPLHGEVFDAYHKWLGTRNFNYLEPYVEAFCRYCTIEKEAGRLHWNYELPTDKAMTIYFKQRHKGRLPKR